MPKLVFHDPNKENEPLGAKCKANNREYAKIRPVFRPLNENNASTPSVTSSAPAHAVFKPQTHLSTQATQSDLVQYAQFTPPKQKLRFSETSGSKRIKTAPRAESDLSRLIGVKALELGAFVGNKTKINAREILQKYEWRKWNRFCLISDKKVLLNPNLVPLDRAFVIPQDEYTFVAYLDDENDHKE